MQAFIIDRFRLSSMIVDIFSQVVLIMQVFGTYAGVHYRSIPFVKYDCRYFLSSCFYKDSFNSAQVCVN